MNTVEQRYNHLPCEPLQSTAELVLPVTTLVSLSLLSLIFIHRYIKYRRRQAHIPISELKQEQDFWLQSITMEKGDIISTDSRFPSACDILQPLSHTSLLPSSGALAAQVREQQRERSAIDASASSPETGEVQKRNESIQQMYDEDAEGGRTWKRVVVEYR
ncbi:hypothetical protein N7491_004612 [Penicillium cf. griseofulvum]|uniref:Uncharacterized protein n=1 Tax=Penicillium cf. griseofulvum TaxID=2972120 RepID=A0A9W9M454_9EURO|nr:hypothetical protein N7472_007302 [Penicillium cf. griseofulvum]KAJ5434017.1 hypothetical protein N7491_004612 [Penicillium cf. griseofulvum]KAJ5451847.1 hypothetical protein N7445_000030 [Penicillium cf. griseofulvum]